MNVLKILTLFLTRQTATANVSQYVFHGAFWLNTFHRSLYFWEWLISCELWVRCDWNFNLKSFYLPLSYQTENNGSSQSNSHGAEQSKNKSNAGVNKKKKQKKRASRRNKYIKKLVQKSFWVLYFHIRRVWWGAGPALLRKGNKTTSIYNFILKIHHGINIYVNAEALWQ